MEQLDLNLFPDTYLVGIRTQAGEIQHYEIEADSHREARTSIKLGVEDFAVHNGCPTILTVIEGGKKTEEKAQAHSHTQSPTRA